MRIFLVFDSIAANHEFPLRCGPGPMVFVGDDGKLFERIEAINFEGESHCRSWKTSCANFKASFCRRHENRKGQDQP